MAKQNIGILIPSPRVVHKDVRTAIQQIVQKLGASSSPTQVGLTLTGLAASRLVWTDASKTLASKDLVDLVAGTTNQIIVTDDADGSITLSAPQDIHTGASPTFAGATITNAAVLASDSVVFRPNADSTTFLQVLDAGGGTPVLNVDTTNGRVSFGTASAQELVHVGAGTGASAITATDLLVTRAGPSNLSVKDSTNVVEIFLFASSAGGIMGTVTNDPLNIQTNNTSAIFIDASQNVTVAGDMSVAGALTATSHGGIVEANLLDKTAAETISGAWEFTAASTTLSSTQPILDFNETDGPADEKIWRWTAAIGDLYLQTKTDALGAGANVLRVTRTGTTVDLIRAVATSVDVVGALTATSYGGITEANLLDKSAVETIGGAWTFSNALTISRSDASADIVLKRVDAFVDFNQDVGTIQFQGGEDGSEEVVALIQAVPFDNWTNTSSPTSLAFHTTPVGATSATERVRINRDGSVGIGTGSPRKDLHIESVVPTIRLSDSDAATDLAVATLIELYRGNNTNRVGFWGMESSSNNTMKLATDYAAGEIAFSTGSSVEAMRINSSQVVTLTNVLTVPNGGMGAGSFTDGGVLLGSGTGAITAMAVLADSEMIVGDGTTDPVAESGSTLRTSIGVSIGSDVQAFDTGLNNLAAVSMAADKMYYTSADNVHVAADLPSFGRTLIANTTAALARADLGLDTGNSPTFTNLTLTGGQIVFPATQVPSSNANTLDDYEEGTFTPTVVFTGGSGTITYTIQSGFYTKIGRSVFFSVDILTASIASRTGSMSIEALPFTSASNSGTINMGFSSGLAIPAGYTLTGIVAGTSARIEMYLWDGTSGPSRVQETEWTNSGRAILTGYYII
ncbi:MAG TPA: hypothetical protein ENH62_06760 [Marinobacter sp.]|nr:hypothetical protein [Marinobacter sp.]